MTRPSFDFIWHLRGSVALRAGDPNEAVLDRVERLLEKQRKPVSERLRDRIAFDSPLWDDMLGPNWLAMIIYDQGCFWIEDGTDRRRLRYDLRSLHGMVFCLFAAVFFFLFGLSDGLYRGLKFGAFGFGWLYGLNILLALVRVPTLIRRAARDS